MRWSSSQNLTERHFARDTGLINIQLAAWKRLIEDQQTKVEEVLERHERGMGGLQTGLVVKAGLDTALNQVWGLIDKFSPMGIEMAKRTRKQQEMVDATKAKLASIEAALDKAEVKEVNWTWSARGTYLRGFTTRSNLIQDWVVPPGYSCTETRCEDGR